MKVRLRFTKLGKIRWTSHRDVARLWERALRRASVPVAYSEGFSPRPKISFGLALPTGAESVAEYLDVDLTGSLDPAEVAERLDQVLPAGIEVTAGIELAGGEPSLQHDVVACRWEIGVPDGAGPGEPAAGLEEAVAGFLAAPEIVVTRERKGQPVTDDIRPAVLSLALSPAPVPASALTPPASVLVAELATRGRALRPGELLGQLGLDVAGTRMVRTHQWIERDGARREPIPPPSAPAGPEAGVTRRDSTDDGTSAGGTVPPERPGDAPDHHQRIGAGRTG